jgi:hypothetical protein
MEACHIGGPEKYPFSIMAEKARKERYIPSLHTIQQAADSLPPAQGWRADSYSVPVNDERLIEFRRIKFKTRDGKTERWVYDGKVLVK